MKFYIPLIFSVLLVSSCGWINEKICGKDIPGYERPRLDIKDPDPIKPRKVEFIVITEKNYKEVFDELKLKGIDPVLFGLTDNNYESLSKNIYNMLIVIESQKEITNSYRDYYEGEKSEKPLINP